MERAREDLGLDDTDPRQHKQAAKMLREEKMLIKKLHEKIVVRCILLPLMHQLTHL